MKTLDERHKFQMSKLERSDEPKVNQCQIKSKIKMSKVLKFELRHSFDICLPTAGRDFEIWHCFETPQVEKGIHEGLH
jgi:hypothetical protein